MSGTNNGQLLDFMRTTLGRIRSEKQGAAETEAGGYSGPSSHPSAKEDDQAQPASEGARSSENTADIKEDVHQGTGVDTRQGTEGGGDDDKQYNIGQQQAATGEDASTEDPDKINAKDDADINNQQTSHPAKGSTKQSEQIKEARALGNKLMAQIAVLNPEGEKQAAEKKPAENKDGDGEKKAEGQKIEGDMKPQEDNKHNYDEDGSQAKESDAGATEKKPKPNPDEKSSSDEGGEDFQAGVEAAKTAAAELEQQEKSAAELVDQIEKSAAVDADLLCDFVAGYHDGQAKAAAYEEGGDMENAEGDEGEDHKGDDEDKEVPADEGGGEGEMDAGAAVEDMMGGGEPEGGAPEGGDLAALLGGGGAPGEAPGGGGDLAALLGGGGAPGGGADLAALLGGGEGAPGGDPGAMLGGGAPEGGMGGVSQAEIAALLQQLVQQQGMGPEAMQVAASFVEDARKAEEQTNRQRQAKQAALHVLATRLSGQLRAIKAAAAKATADKKQPVAAAAPAAPAAPKPKQEPVAAAAE